jgi:hypothetical protein
MAKMMIDGDFGSSANHEDEHLFLENFVDNVNEDQAYGESLLADWSELLGLAPTNTLDGADENDFVIRV